MTRQDFGQDLLYRAAYRCDDECHRRAIREPQGGASDYHRAASLMFQMAEGKPWTLTIWSAR